FEGRSPIEVMIKAIDGKKTPLRELRPEVPVELEAIVDKMMHKVPDERYQDMGAVLEDLQRVLVVA
ncbi:MAG TPA: serine/threonine protein kinase, partial [Planctomycetota bacterium]|nr:serine/threonine protein kinase [Planctomycetota bacterium]